MRVPLNLRELFLVILLVATISLFLNIQANYYGILINGGKLVFSLNATDDVTERAFVTRETFKIIGGRSLNQHGPEMTSLYVRSTNVTSKRLFQRLIEIENRLMSISRQPIIALVNKHEGSDVIEKFNIKKIPLQILKTSDHLGWIDNRTVVQNGNWSVLLCTDSNLCPAYPGTSYKKVNNIKEITEYINNPRKLCELSRKIDDKFRDFDCTAAKTDKNISNGKDSLSTGWIKTGTDRLIRQSPENSFLPIYPYLKNAIMLSTSGPLLRLRMLVTSLMPLRVYIHSTVFSGPNQTLNSDMELHQITVEEILQYISETYELGMSTRWWITLQTTLVKYLTQITIETEGKQMEAGCYRCFKELYVDISCSSVEHCLVLQMTDKSILDEGSLFDTLALISSYTTSLHDVSKALQDSQICDYDSASCLTDTDLIYLLDSRREQLIDSDWIKIYPSKESSSVHGDMNKDKIGISRRHSALSNQILSNIEQYYNQIDAENKNGIDVPYDTDTGIQNNPQSQEELYSPVNFMCSEGPEIYKDIDIIHTEPAIQFKEIKRSHLYAEVQYETILVRIWAYAKSCRCVVTLDNKYNSPGARHVSIGLGNNTFHLLVIDQTLPSPTVVSSVALTIYRHSRGLMFKSPSKLKKCELKQDCSLPFDDQTSCGLLRSRDSSKLLRAPCTSGDAEGRWIVPCSDCRKPSSCVWGRAKWQPFKCSYIAPDTWSLKQCLHGKKLLFIGDSTNRGVMNYIMERINGTLRQWDKIHNTRAYTNLNNNSTHLTFAYYPHFWLPSQHRPKFQKIIYQLIKSSLPLYNNASTVLIVGGVQWLAKEHIDSIIEALKRKGLLNITVVIKGLGAGFHQLVEGVRFVPPGQQQVLQQKEHEILFYAKDNGFRVVSTFNMTVARYRDFLEGKCACHFHKVSKVVSDDFGDDVRYTISGDVNAAYSNIVAHQICGEHGNL